VWTRAVKSFCFDSFLLVTLLVLASGVLYVVRSQTGSTLGIDIGAEGYVVGTGDEHRALGGNREVIEVGDRMVTLAGRPVTSLAEVGDVLRSLDVADATGELTVPVTLERRGYRFGESLNYREVQERGFPSSIEVGDRVVGYDDHEVRGDIDRSTILAILANRHAQRVTFYFERPEHHYSVELPLQPTPFPAWPVMLFSIALVVSGAIAWRARSTRARSGPPPGHWLGLAVSTLAAPWVLVLLWDPAAQLQDPLLLLPALLSLALYRPVSLDLHRRLFGGTDKPLLTLAVLLPGLVVAFVGMLLTMELGTAMLGGPVSVGKELDVIGLIRAACGMMAIYHTLDLVLWFRHSARLRQNVTSALLAPQLGLIVSSLALLSALLFWINDPGPFVAAGFVFHAAGLVLVQWLGDAALIVLPPLEVNLVERPTSLNPNEASAALCDFLLQDAAALGLHGPELVVVRGRFAVVMACRKVESDEATDDEVAEAGVSLSVARASEPVRAGVGLLRDESVTLPLAQGHPTGREEHSGEVLGPVEVVKSVVDSLGVSTAFCILDDADCRDELSHLERNDMFYAYIVDYGAPNHALQWSEIERLRARFVDLWPGARQLILETLLREEMEGRPSSSPPRVKIERTVERVETVRVQEPADYRFLRRDIAVAYPIDEPDLLEEPLLEQLEEMAHDDAPVVMVGPVGIGKEFVARKLHALSALARGPFVKFPVSMSAPAVREVELFGDDVDPGHLRASQGGVLYIDDALELGGALLDRLLGEIGQLEHRVWLILGVRSPLGADLEPWIQGLDGSLGQICRGFLAHRVIRLRPLVERPELVEALTWHFLVSEAMQQNKVIARIADDVMELLCARDWPAGVPELRFAIARAVIRCQGDELKLAHFESELSLVAAPASAPAAPAPGLRAEIAEASDLRALLDRVQGLIYEEALGRESGNKTAAARQLGVKRSAFNRTVKPD